MSKSKITGKVLAIRLGREESQIILRSAGAEILHSALVPTPAGAVEDGMIRNPDAVRQMLKSALSAREFKATRRVVFSLCTSQVITEVVTTPELPAPRLEKLLQANADMYFPVDMKDYQMVWQTIGPKENTTGLKELAIRLWAVPVAMISRYYNVANACGLSVEAIDYCGNSVATAVGATFSRPARAAKKQPKERKKLDLNMEISFGKKKDVEPKLPEVSGEPRYVPDTDVYICLEHDLLGMTFVQEGQVVLQRFVQCGSNPARQFGELSMMVEYFRSLDVGRGSFISGVLLGSLAGDEVLTEDLADVLGITLTPFVANYDLRWAICLGASRTARDFGSPALNHPGKVAKQVGSQAWQYVLILASGLAVVAVMMLTMSARMTWDAERAALESERQMLTIQAQQSAGFADNYEDYEALYEKYNADWTTIFSSLKTYNDNLVLVLEELEETLPKNTSVAQLMISYEGLTVKFACETKEDAAHLIMALRELKYADLDYVSNLTGGGKGPSDSYGPNEETPPTEEAPPTEGSTLRAIDTSTLENLLISQFPQDKLMDIALSLTPQQVDQLQFAYGKKPAISYRDFDALVEYEKPTQTNRANALKQLLSTNPFAMERFAELMDEDLLGDFVVWDAISDDLLLPENRDLYEAFTSGGLNGAANLKKFADKLVNILVATEENRTATEQLICTDTDMEQWYIYYMEVELGITVGEKLPFLNMDKIIDDLLAGGFDTGDTALDQKLNGLVPAEAWILLETLKNNNSNGGDGSGSGNGSGNGSGSGTEQVKDPVNNKLPNELTQQDVNQIVNLYIRDKGKLGDFYINLVDRFLRGESTGFTNLDYMLNIAIYGNSGGNGGGDTEDTRVYFSVILSYNEELAKAELDRKGLSEAEKVEKLEVSSK